MRKTQYLLIQIATMAGVLSEINNDLELMISDLKTLIGDEHYDIAKYMESDAVSLEAPMATIIAMAKKLMHKIEVEKDEQ